MSKNIEERLATIETKIDIQTSWVKSLDNKVGLQNGKVNKNENSIIIVKEKLDNLLKHIKDIDGWSRVKTIAVYGGIQTLVISLLIWYFTK